MLTQAQLKTLKFIKKFIKKFEHAPTTAEIAEGIGIQSRGVVHRYLKALEDAKKIELIPGRKRNITLLDDATNNLSNALSAIPLLGAIAAGHPIEAVQSDEYVDVMDIFSGPHRYALRVKGDSMIEEGIFDGDLVICEHSQRARNGQIVVALIDEQEATLKRLRYEENNAVVTLQPANANYEPMKFSAERVKIQGIYIGLVRTT